MCAVLQQPAALLGSVCCPSTASSTVRHCVLSFNSQQHCSGSVCCPSTASSTVQAVCAVLQQPAALLGSVCCPSTVCITVHAVCAVLQQPAALFRQYVLSFNSQQHCSCNVILCMRFLWLYIVCHPPTFGIIVHAVCAILLHLTLMFMQCVLSSYIWHQCSCSVCNPPMFGIKSVHTVCAIQQHFARHICSL
ncbi:hypothetical protein BsWGS_08342 [Bradybaena similaris]